MSTKNASQRMVSLAVIIATVAAGLALFTYLQTVTGAGFTGPPSGLPGTTDGMISVDSGRTAVTIGGKLVLDSGGGATALIENVSDPIAATDVVNKQWAEANLGAAGAADGEYYYLTCKWSDFEPNPVGIGSPLGIYAEGCGPPACEAGDTTIGSSSWITSYDFELIEYTPPAYVWTIFGITRTVCQVPTS